MPKDRFTSPVDVHLILRHGDEILLGRRQNTGFHDGDWHLPSGHLEAGESATAALIREAAEETGVSAHPDGVRFAHLMHHHTNASRTALFFEVAAWDGEVVNREPDKCAGWKWFPLDALPDQMIPYAAEALTHYAKGQPYSERGWS